MLSHSIDVYLSLCHPIKFYISWLPHCSFFFLYSLHILLFYFHVLLLSLPLIYSTVKQYSYDSAPQISLHILFPVVIFYHYYVRRRLDAEASHKMSFKFPPEDAFSPTFTTHRRMPQLLRICLRSWISHLLYLTSITYSPKKHMEAALFLIFPDRPVHHGSGLCLSMRTEEKDEWMRCSRPA